MKRNFVVIVGIIIALVGNIDMAVANFFDDSEGKWYMNFGQWTLSVSNDPLELTNLADNNNTLEFTSQGWPVPDSYEVERSYLSKWAFDLSHNFEFNIGFHFNHIGTRDDDEAGIAIYLTDSSNAYMDLTALNEFIRPQDISNEFGVMPNTDVQIYDSELWVSSGDETWNWWWRCAADGLFVAKYDANQNVLTLTSFENGIEAGNAAYSNLKADYNCQFLQVGLGAECDGGVVSAGDAYLQNFNIVEGTIVPEPLSCALFLVGGGVLFAGRKVYRKR